MNTEKPHPTTIQPRISADAPTTVETPPDTVASVLAHRGDPSLKKVSATARGVDRFDPRSVAWVRMSDVLSVSTAQLAGRGISFAAELYRRIRQLPAQTVAASRTAISNRSHRLPPITAFGHSRSHVVQGPARSGVETAR